MTLRIGKHTSPTEKKDVSLAANRCIRDPKKTPCKCILFEYIFSISITIGFSRDYISRTFPVSTRYCFNVVSTLLTSKQRCINVQMTSHTYGVTLVPLSCLWWLREVYDSNASQYFIISSLFLFCLYHVKNHLFNPLIFSLLIEDRMLHKETWFVALLGNLTKVRDYKSAISRRDNSSFAVKGSHLPLCLPSTVLFYCPLLFSSFLQMLRWTWLQPCRAYNQM